ncbi:hypothetical protein ACJX0J_011738, partial [Zea mays]
MNNYFMMVPVLGDYYRIWLSLLLYPNISDATFIIILAQQFLQIFLILDILVFHLYFNRQFTDSKIAHILFANLTSEIFDHHYYSLVPISCIADWVHISISKINGASVFFLLTHELNFDV